MCHDGLLKEAKSDFLRDHEKSEVANSKFKVQKPKLIPCDLQFKTRNLSLNRDFFDPQGGEGLAVALALVISLPPFHFENDDLLRPALIQNLSHHFDIGQIGAADQDLLSLGVVKDPGEFDLVALLAHDLFDPQGVPGRDLVLFSPCLNDGVHRSPPI
jgi:hypothetical protein